MVDLCCSQVRISPIRTGWPERTLHSSMPGLDLLIAMFSAASAASRQRFTRPPPFCFGRVMVRSIPSDLALVSAREWEARFKDYANSPETAVREKTQAFER